MAPTTSSIHQSDDVHSEIHVWRPDWFLRIVLFGTSLTFILTWLPLVRGLLDGETYRWGFSYFGISFNGAGIGGDYWLLILQAIWLFTIFTLGMRGARWPFHWVLLTWHGLLGLNALYDALFIPGGATLRGDTLGIEIDITVIALVITGGLALLALLWVLHDLRNGDARQVPPWHRYNTVALMLILALLPLQYFLLRFDASGNQSDVIGVLLTIPQALLFPWAFWPWRGFSSRVDGPRDADLTHSTAESTQRISRASTGVRYTGYGYTPAYSAWSAREPMLETIFEQADDYYLVGY